MVGWGVMFEQRLGRSEGVSNALVSGKSVLACANARRESGSAGSSRHLGALDADSSGQQKKVRVTPGLGRPCPRKDFSSTVRKLGSHLNKKGQHPAEKACSGCCVEEWKVEGSSRDTRLGAMAVILAKDGLSQGDGSL